jgi:hypothetical protein
MCTYFKCNFEVLMLLGNKKDFIAAIKDIITVMAVIIGGLLSYFKFFSGRTFFAKADIEFDITVLPHADNSLHTIKFSLINKGNITIWQPNAKIGIRKFINPDDPLNVDHNHSQCEIVKDLCEKSFFDEDKKHSYMVDPGEKIFFILHRNFERKVWAVSYDVEIVSKSGDIWKNTCTISNSNVSTPSSKNNSSITWLITEG